MNDLTNFDQNDQLFFRRLYESHRQSLYQNILQIVRCESASEDILQDVFIQLWIRRDQLNAIGDVPAYLFSMSRNCAIDHLRRKKRLQSILMHYRAEQEPPVFFDDEVIKRETEVKIAKEVARLPGQQRLAFQLSKQNGWKGKQVAQAMDISLLTVKTHLKKAMHALRDSLQKEY